MQLNALHCVFALSARWCFMFEYLFLHNGIRKVLNPCNLLLHSLVLLIRLVWSTEYDVSLQLLVNEYLGMCSVI